jgi:hypothetical protein
LPVERFPTHLLVRRLYSHAALSADQLRGLLRALRVRTRVAHGFVVPEADIVAAIGEVGRIASELLPAPMERAA